MTLAYTIERFRRRQQVRYWALGLPLLILAITLPMLRPLRLPDASAVSDNERVRLATIEAIALRGSLMPDPKAVEGAANLIEVTGPDGERVILAAQEPMLAVMGAGVYQVLRLFDIRPSPDEVLGAYLLTAVLSALPCAVAAVLLYRIGRLMELGRARRMGVALLAVIGGGLIPYATVLSVQPMAAMLVAASMACVVHVATTSRVVRRGSDREGAGVGVGFGFWLAWGGFLGGLGGAVMPMVAPMVGAVGLGLLGMPWKRRVRLLGVVVFSLGVLPPAAGHKLLLTPYGDVWTVPMPSAAPPVEMEAEPTEPADEAAPAVEPGPSALQRLAKVLVGPFGVLSHAPVVLLGVAGVGRLLLKYWPGATRWLAVMTVMGAAVPLLWWAWGPVRGGERMWGPQPVVAVLPVLVLWAGVLLRPGGLSGLGAGLRTLAWGVAVFSLTTGLLGMSRPFLRGGYTTYPPWVLVQQWVEARKTVPPATPGPATSGA